MEVPSLPFLVDQMGIESLVPMHFNHLEIFKHLTKIHGILGILPALQIEVECCFLKYQHQHLIGTQNIQNPRRYKGKGMQIALNSAI